MKRIIKTSSHFPKIALRTLLLLCFFSVSNSIFAYDDNVLINGIYYRLNGYDATVTYKGGTDNNIINDYTGIVNIPSTFQYNGYTYTVIGIGDHAFCASSGLTGVSIPNTVTLIDDRAFHDCSSLTSITIPNSVTTIGQYAFDGCTALASITIPNSVTSIDRAIFANCGSLNSITVSSGNPKYDSRNNCNAIVETSSNKIIAGCKNTTIPNSVTEIGDWSFYNCNGLTSVFIPNSVTQIGEYAFDYSRQLTSVTFGNSVREIGHAAFSGCSSLSEIIFSNSITAIGIGAFSDCDSLKNVIIPNSVTSIGNSAFAGCSGLESATIGNSVIVIGDKAFMNCGSLTSVTIGESVTLTGYATFEYCNSLVNVTCLATTPPEVGNGTSWGTYTFHPNITQQATLYVPVGTVSAYQSAYNWWDFSNILEIANGNISFADANVKALCVQNWDTNGDGELSGVEAAAVTDLNQVFRGQNSITSFDELQYFTGLKAIGSGEFYNCRRLNSITLPNTILSIGSWSFYHCERLKNIIIPNSVTSIGQDAFSNCSSLISINIPESLTSFADNPFYGCNSLNTIMVDRGNPKYDSRNDCNAIIETESNTLFAGCKNTTIPNSVTIIGNEAFHHIESLTSINIPNSITSIGSMAFYGCSGLTNIIIPSSVSYIGGLAFYSNNNISSISCFATIPPSTGSSGSPIFNDIVKNQAFLCVPIESIDQYHNNPYWNFTNIDPFINFSDESVKSICVQNWDSNNDGELTLSEAASVTTLNLAFKYQSNITSLDDLQYFKGLQSIDNLEFFDCINLTSIIIPCSVTSIGYNSFINCRSLSNIVVETGNPKYDSRNNCNAIIETESEILVAGCKNTVFPNTITEIGMYAFRGQSGLLSIDIPNTVKSIGTSAFYDCDGLTNVVIPNSVISLGNYSFAYCDSLTCLILGNSLKEICDGAFVHCGKLNNNITIPNSVISIGQQAFAYCYSLTNVSIGDSVTTIGNDAFAECHSLKKISIGNSVYNIGNSAFYRCYALSEIIIPNSVKYIGNGAFKYNNNLKNVTIGQNVKYIYEEAFYRANLVSVSCLAVTPPSLRANVFTNPENATLYVPAESIEDYRSTDGWKDFFAIEGVFDTNMFEVDGIYYIKTSDNTVSVTYKDQNYNSYSGDVIIPSSVTFEGKTYQVTEIGEYAFSFSGNLMSVSIPSTVTKISNCAFQECSSLSYISIPNSVEEIGDHAFDYAGLTDVSIGNAVKIIGGNAFTGCQFTTLTLPEGLLTIEDNAFSECSMMNAINLPGTLTSIGDNAFDMCSSLTSVTIPESVTHIGIEAFEECHNLISMVVESGNIVYDSRDNCNAIVETSTSTLISGCKTSLIPNTITAIGDYAFYLCSGIDSISIPSSVKSIGNNAFCGSSNLSTISIGENVDTIGENAFLDCDGIISVTCLASIPPSMANLDCFSNVVYGNAVLKVPTASLESYIVTDFWNKFLNIEGITNGVEENTNIYIVGSSPFGDWSPNNGVKLKHIGDGIYTLRANIDGTIWFVFADGLVEDDDWETFNIEYRLGPIGEIDQTVNVGEYITTQKQGNGSGAYKLPAKSSGSTEYKFTFDLNNMRFIVEDNFDRWDKLQDGVYWDGSTLYICSFVTSLGDLGVNPTAIYSFASVPPTCTDNTFTGYGAFLTMPAASYGAYFTAEYWCNFAYMYNDAIETTGITLSNSEAILTVGESVSLTANVSPNNASYQGTQWRSTNQQVATVNYEGQITAHAVGECDIIASCVFYQAVCHVIVEDARIVISLDKHEASILPNHALTITPTMSPQQTTLKLNVSDPNVAAARLMNGVVQVVGLTEGTTVIEVGSEDGLAIPDTCIVTVYTEPGDVNCDGFINISDVTSLIDYLLSGNPQGLKVDNADTNRDSKVNISDVTTLIDYLLSGHWPDVPVTPTDNHEYVDLGLSSGTLWATMNIGANSPEDYGDYFAWGETEPKDYYDWDTYKWCNGSYTSMTKYCTLSEYGNNGFIDNKTELDPEDDAAYVNWGSLWRMPSKAQIDELNLECTWRWTQRNGVNGLLVTGTNGNSMFLPAAGGRWYELLCDVDNWGFYWSRTLQSGDPYFAFDLYFDSGKVYWDMDGHYAGFTVRAVRVSQN